MKECFKPDLDTRTQIYITGGFNIFGAALLNNLDAGALRCW